MTGFIGRLSSIRVRGCFYVPLLSLFAATAFGQSVVVMNAPPNGAVLSGTYTMSGYALSYTAAVASVQVSLANGGYTEWNAHYGDPTTGVCPNYAGWVGCSTGNVGWDLTVDTTTLPQGSGPMYAVAMPSRPMPLAP